MYIYIPVVPLKILLETLENLVHCPSVHWITSWRTPMTLPYPPVTMKVTVCHCNPCSMWFVGCKVWYHFRNALHLSLKFPRLTKTLKTFWSFICRNYRETWTMQLWQHCQHRSWDARLVFDLRAVFGRMQIWQSRMQEELQEDAKRCEFVFASMEAWTKHL